MSYSRGCPSERYLELVSQYQTMHTEGFFSGIGAYKHQRALRTLVRETGARTLLDYGCGQGNQFRKDQLPKALFAKLKVYCESWQEALGVDRITGYDPGVEQFATPPLGKFDGVMSVDVCEHLPENDLPWILEEIFSYAEKFVFLTVATVPAKKNLPNGENAHITLRSPEWWCELIDSIARQYPKIRYQIVFEEGNSKET